MLRSFALAAIFASLLLVRTQAAQVSYFTVDPVLSHQIVGTPFNVTATARDTAGNPVFEFSGPVDVHAVDEVPRASQPMLGDIGYTGFSGAVSAGFGFTPTSDITVTHVRHFSGGRISIWTGDGVLLTARDVLNFGDQWL